MHTETQILKRALAEAPTLFQGDLRHPSKKQRAASDAASLSRSHPQTLSSSAETTYISPPGPEDQPILSKSVSALVKTYCCKDIVSTFGQSDCDIQQASGDRSIELFLAIERVDRHIEIQQMFRRIWCYEFAQLHPKGTSVDPIVQKIQNAWPHPVNITQKVYSILRAGNKWIAVVERLASIVKMAPQDVTGVLCHFRHSSNWERAISTDHESALTLLYNTTDLFQKTLQATPMVNRVLQRVHSECSFVEQSRTFATQSNVPTNADGLDTVPEAVLGLNGTESEDAHVLLTLLSLLSTSDEVPMNLLSRGASLRKRWTIEGEVEEVDADRVGVAPQLANFLSDTSRLSKALQKLEEEEFVVLSSTAESTKAYKLNEATASNVRAKMSKMDLSFWSYQAMIVTYRAISWKYLETPPPNSNLFLPHLQHILEGFGDRLKDLPATTRADLILTLIEALRFPKIVWKRFALSQAEAASHGLEDSYVHCCIAQSRSLLQRISGDMVQAVSSLSEFDHSRPSSTTSKKMHSAMGQATIQEALNSIQVEDISGAKRSLVGWSPLKQPSPMEEVVLFRMNMMLGRLSRYQGDFAGSLTHLKKVQKTAEKYRVLVFQEDLGALTCELADTLRELDDPVTAERYVRAEIARRAQQLNRSPSQSLLDLSLAEVLFAQQRFDESDQICSDIQSRPSLLKFEKLRLHITRAKIRHLRLENEEAMVCWSEAMATIGKFHLTNGRSTQIIVLSICDILGRMGQTWLVDSSLKQAASLDTFAKPGGTDYWIAGMRHWSKHLKLQNLSRM